MFNESDDFIYLSVMNEWLWNVPMYYEFVWGIKLFGNDLIWYDATFVGIGKWIELGKWVSHRWRKVC